MSAAQAQTRQVQTRQVQTRQAQTRRAQTNVIVVDDHDVARLGLIAVLESIPGVRVVAEASDAPGLSRPTTRIQCARRNQS